MIHASCAQAQEWQLKIIATAPCCHAAIKNQHENIYVQPTGRTINVLQQTWYGQTLFPKRRKTVFALDRPLLFTELCP